MSQPPTKTATYYRGRGEHSVNQLEQMVETLREENIKLRAPIANTAPAPIASKSEMKRVAALDPQKAAEELARLREEVRRLQDEVEKWKDLAADLDNDVAISRLLNLKDKGR